MEPPQRSVTKHLDPVCLTHRYLSRRYTDSENDRAARLQALAAERDRLRADLAMLRSRGVGATAHELIHQVGESVRALTMRNRKT